MLQSKLKITIFSVACVMTAMLFASCNQNNASVVAEKPINADSLELAWDNAWNSANTDAIKSMLANDAIVFEDGWSVTGIDSLMKNFVMRNTAGMKSIRTEKVKSSASNTIAFFVGNYFVETKGEPSKIIKGPFTTVWTKQNDNSWKIVSLHTGTVK